MATGNASSTTPTAILASMTILSSGAFHIGAHAAGLQQKPTGKQPMQIADVRNFAAPIQAQQMQQNALAGGFGMPAPAPGYNALAAFGGPTREAAAAVDTSSPFGGLNGPQSAAKAPESGVKALDIAGSAIGLNEHDKKSALSDYLRTGGQNLDPATTAWCAAFVNATLAQSGIEGTNDNLARSFLKWGEAVDDPREGDLAVFTRGDPNGWQGHVGFFKGYNPDGTISVLGGNQSDAVNISSYSPNRLLGFRRYGAAAPQPQQAATPEAPAQSFGSVDDLFAFLGV